MTIRPLALRGAAAIATALGSLSGCTASPVTTAYTPITGIQVPASQIVAGHGCGTGSQQVYRYAAAVGYASPEGGMADRPFTSGIFDCFADGIFANLPASDGGNYSFFISIYAYNQCSFPHALDCPPGAAPCPGEDAGVLAPWTPFANWKTTCTQTEYAGSTAMAACQPLEVSDAGSCGDDGPSRE